MNDIKEIVLYYKDGNVTYKELDVAKELQDRYPELGKPILIREGNNTNKTAIIFDNLKEFKIEINHINVSFLIYHSYFDKINSLIFDCIDIFDSQHVAFKRIGYLSNINISDSLKDILENKYLNVDNIKGVPYLNVFNEIEVKGYKVNIWERIDFEHKIIKYDFNTNQNEEVKFDMKFIKEFTSSSNSFMDGRLS